MLQKKRKIVVHILSIFVFLFLLGTGVIIVHSYLSSRSAVLKLADTLVIQEHQAIIKKLNASLSPAPFLKISSYLVADGVLSLSEMQSLSSFMQMMLKLYPEFSSVYLADNRGNMFLESHYSKGFAKYGSTGLIAISEIPPQTKFISEMIARQKNNTVLMVYYKDEEGKLIKQSNSRISFDPRMQLWFKGALANLDHHWVGIYTQKSPSPTPFPQAGQANTKPKFSLAHAIQNKEGGINGVLGADLDIDNVQNQLTEIDTHPDKYVFILNHFDQLIASTKNMQDPHQTFLSPIENNKNVIAKSAYHLHRKLKKDNVVFSVRGRAYEADFTPFSFDKKSSWEIVSIIPLDFYTMPLEHVNQYNLLFSSMILLLGLGLILIASRKISRPIIYLATETNKITRLFFEGNIKLFSRIYEIAILVEAFNKAKTALSSFTKYVPKVLVAQLLKSKKIAQVGGENKVVTLLFTDIANFTALSEKVEPQYLMVHLSEYLNLLTGLIHHYRGNVDKYIGDAVMAFWGAPLENPHHVEDACKATLACRDQVKKINQQWSLEGKPMLPTRFGLASGLVVIGNVGSVDRLNYTAIGDTVNLAARLEVLNKVYGTDIIVSDVVYEQCKEQFLFRPLDKVAVRGKQKSVEIYELIASKERTSEFFATPLQQELCESSRKAYEAFHAGRKEEALEQFKEMQKRFPEDGMVRVYLER